VLTRNFDGIRTKRLTIRELREQDATTMYGYRSHAEVARYQSWRPTEADEVKRFIAANAARRELCPGDWHQRAIAARDDSLVGDIGLHLIGDGQFEIGITIAPEFQHRGLATEAITAILDRLFDKCGVHGVCASVDPRNLKSIELMHRLGFLVREERSDDVRFAILDAEWRSRE
jgi:RimJ/RimL family protein N-acetyltransferase